MKNVIKIAILLSLFASCVPAFGQNLVGSSKKVIYDTMHDKGLVVHDYKETETTAEYYFVMDGDMTRMYVFNNNNLCVKYCLFIEKETFSGMEDLIFGQGYVKHVDGYYYTDEYVAKIEYNSKSECWVFVIIANK